ncbi:MAG: hypothetical protein KC433_17035 [Anaerolineales bacterium]|nr:hypothetical protein [Anaerolineales bacterium]MCB8939153.1 hypothetical protein [Ardenticatenaceae bacterium]
MSSIRTEERTCSICKTSNQFKVLRAASSHEIDLDTRPYGNLRPTIDTWIQSCPVCGYCAPDISIELDQANPIITQATYLEQLQNNNYPELANHFLCWAIIQEEIEHYVEAGWGSIHAAWVCDDVEREDSAKACRLLTLQRFQKARNKKLPFAQEKNAEELILADLYRRTRQFKLTKDICLQVINQNPDTRLKQIAEFQIVLAASFNDECHKWVGG